MIYVILALIFGVGTIISYFLFEADFFQAKWRTNTVIISILVCFTAFIAMFVTTYLVDASAEGEIEKFRYEIHITMNNLALADSEEEYQLCLEECEKVNAKITDYKKQHKNLSSKYSLVNMDKLQHIKLNKGE